MASNAALCPRSLRLIASVVSITAGSIMLTASQTTIAMDSLIHVNYGDLATFRCFVLANFAVAVYSFLLIFLPAGSQLWRLVVALDLLLVVTLASSCFAALEVGVMESTGNSHAGWLPICHKVPSYCLKVFLAVGFGFVGAATYVILQLLTIQAAFNSILVGDE